MKTLIILLGMLLATGYCAQYAVLVAGSNGYYNYRHQSDVCHSYQILISNGFPAANIIVLAYDDIANSAQNPFPGTMYNKPTGTDPGDNVYAGCAIDYKGSAVTAANFLAVIKGDKAAIKGGNGRVLESGSNDEVFIYYSDHGSVGLIAFPVGPYLYADDQLDAFTYMFQNNKFSKLTYYLESCESGSMFVDLPKNQNIYALSAANPSESSWATYCPPEDEVDGKHIGTCLGDEFSVNWMENTMAQNPSTYTLEDQFTAVEKTTIQSQVMQWGDTTFTDLPIGTFQGAGKGKSFLEKVIGVVKKTFSTTSVLGKEDARDTKVNYLLRQFKSDPSNTSVYQELINDIETTRKFAHAVDMFARNHMISGIYFGSTNFDCYKTIVNSLTEQCGPVNEASQRYFLYLYQYCAMYTFWDVPTFIC